jgi:tetratricopeptide (TPR) repeat protein
MLAMSLVEQNRLAEAADPLKKAFEAGTLPADDNEVLGVALAQIYVELGMNDQAEDALAKTINLVPQPKENTYYLYSVVLLQNKKPVESKKYAQLALQSAIKPKLEYYQLMAACAQETGDYDTAVGCMELLIEAKPDNQVYWEQLVATQFGQGNFMGALMAIERGQEAGMLQDAKYQLARVEIYHQLERYKAAADLLRQGLLSGNLPNELNLWLLWSSCHESLFDPKGAKEVLVLASKRTSFSDIDMRLAEINWGEKKYAETIKNLKSALKKGGIENPSDLWVLMTTAAIELRDFEQAAAALKEARKYPEAADRVERLDLYLKSVQQAAEKAATQTT